jgi:hypothetical protein
MARRRSRFVMIKDEAGTPQYINIDSINFFSFSESTQVNKANHYKVTIDVDNSYYDFIIDEKSFLDMCEALDIEPEGF